MNNQCLENYTRLSSHGILGEHSANEKMWSSTDVVQDVQDRQKVRTGILHVHGSTSPEQHKL
eukprot:CAMPEP_0184739972 /NCGR_PEP_ID=MMETSP0315-20130426/2925_1 /TAXON_ID=101924 /ORGANISM="Rhodosorus marinus, Strain UTEX LB 2760" /LENGTH=61 /DNA_ID=CAMNT_0027209283 /DNA_START=62 /DNA_END=247 /DNA_ORIENTATION=+